MNKSIPKKVFIGVIIGIVVIVLVSLVFRDQLIARFFSPTVTEVQSGVSIESADDVVDITEVATNLDTPWAVAELPSGDLLVTERPGTLRIVGENEQSYEITGVSEFGEGGLLGVAVHPEHDQNGYIYLYKTVTSGGVTTNQIERYRLQNNTLSDRQVVLDEIPGAGNHNGGRIAFGPDGYLYISTGDAGDDRLSQIKESLAGKILRITDEGQVPSDNPFGSEVYSIGHRNVQGMTWDEQGRMWATEHGRSGLRSGFDELNLIKKGANYGWPIVEGDENRGGLTAPALHSGADDTWAPGGIAYAEGSLFFTGLRGQSLYQVTIDGDTARDLKAHFRQEYGRLREVVMTSGGNLLVSTSNRDGRGEPRSSDDRVLQVDIRLFD